MQRDTVRAGLALAAGLLAGLVVSVAPARAENRPSETPLFQMLNGEVSRELNAVVADGGGLTLMTLDAGIGCNLVATGAVYEMHCDSPVHFCAWEDGGCSVAIGSQSYGRPVNASTPSSPSPYFFVTKSDPTVGATKQVCMTPASGDAQAICALFKLR